MSVKKWLSKIGLFLRHVIYQVDKSIKKLDPRVRRALEIGSGIVSEINAGLLLAPDELFKLIQARFPEASREEIFAWLKFAADQLNTAKEFVDAVDLEKVLAAIQVELEKLKSGNGSKWALKSYAIASWIATMISPKGTKVSLIHLVLETFYQLYIKK